MLRNPVASALFGSMAFLLLHTSCRNQCVFTDAPYQNDLSHKDELICNCRDVRSSDSLSGKIAQVRGTGYAYAYCKCLDINGTVTVVQYWPMNGPFLSSNHFLVLSGNSITQVIGSRDQMLHYLSSQSLSQAAVDSFMGKYDRCQAANKGASGMF